MSKKYYVYVDYTEDTDEPFYVGKGNERRLKVSKRNKKHAAVKNKHGIVRRCVFESKDEELVFDKERELIAEYHTFVHDPLANRLASNFTRGGDGVSGHIPSQKERENVSKAHKGKPFSKEHCENISKAKKGKPLSPKCQEHLKKLNKNYQHRKNLSKAIKESPCAQEQLKRVQESNRGKPLTEERRKNISIALKKSPLAKEHLKKLNKNPQYQALRKEHLKKLQKSVNQYTSDGKLIATHESINEASKSVCGSIKQAGHIVDVCRGKRKTCAGFKWKYAKDVKKQA